MNARSRTRKTIATGPRASRGAGPHARNGSLTLLLALTVLTSAIPALAADAAYGADDAATAAPARWYTFGWPLDGDDDHAPRGGTTEGVAVTRDPAAAEVWRDLQEADLAPLERDRRAIRALAGEFRTSFDFVETVTYAPGLARARPYQSWATEYVFVIEDRPDFISLQHVLVMSFVEDGEVRGPFVQKHWRQDWRLQADRALVFEGDRHWRVAPAAALEGSWTQTVHQVDDTPRYAATGRWTHEGGYSVWESARAWRPLPRREHSVRDDYDVMDSLHRVSITPEGWTHEQDNRKARLGEDGRLDAELPYLAREQGLARYTRIAAYDFDAGRSYWRLTSGYWDAVRAWWDRRLAADGAFELVSADDGRPLFMPLFEGAARLEAGDPGFDAAAIEAYVQATLERYVRTP
ncbi:MAG TPA: DUF6607 family protein [Pseudomonadales bacterium]|nr:DUF6607 family protein [Pseudomonadales bacterium]